MHVGIVFVCDSEEGKMERKKEGEGRGTEGTGEWGEDGWREAWRESQEAACELAWYRAPIRPFPISQQGDWRDGIDQPVSFTKGGGGSDGGN